MITSTNYKKYYYVLCENDGGSDGGGNNDLDDHQLAKRWLQQAAVVNERDV